MGSFRRRGAARGCAARVGRLTRSPACQRCSGLSTAEQHWGRCRGRAATTCVSLDLAGSAVRFAAVTGWSSSTWCVVQRADQRAAAGGLPDVRGRSACVLIVSAATIREVRWAFQRSNDNPSTANRGVRRCLVEGGCSGERCSGHEHRIGSRTFPPVTDDSRKVMSNDDRNSRGGGGSGQP